MLVKSYNRKGKAFHSNEELRERFFRANPKKFYGRIVSLYDLLPEKKALEITKKVMRELDEKEHS